MGQAMGADFSGVKVHTDSQSDQLNKSIQAKAFTTGQDVFFRQGAYEPSSQGGQELIAHELTHVVQQNGGAVQRSHVAASDIIQRTSVTVISKGMFQGTARLYDKLGNVVGTLDAGRNLDITTEEKLIGNKDLVRISEDCANALDHLTSAVDTADLWINKARCVPMAGASDELENEEDEVAIEAEAGPLSYKNGVVTIPIFDNHKLEIGKSGVDVKGELPSEEIELDLGILSGVGISIDIPFAPGAYGTAGLAITPKVSFGISGGTYSIKTGEKTLSIEDASVTGTMGLEIQATAGAGAGLANFVGLEGGIFGTLEGIAKLEGTLEGIADFKSESYDLNLGLNASADIIGKVGLYARAKLLSLSAETRYNLAEKQFAHFSYNRRIKLGGNRGAWLPTLEDFTQTDYGNKKNKKTLKMIEGEIYEELIDEDEPKKLVESQKVEEEVFNPMHGR
jgi:hypothetical protein